MAIYIDPPFWPAHGTLWSHLVSDTSYAELHQFAARLKLPRRSFDLDHYDVPAASYTSVVEAGAIAVGTRVLVHRLRDSGLRIKHVFREAARPVVREAYLHEEWARLASGLSAHGLDPAPDAWRHLGRELLARWNEPHRHYHDPHHLEDVLLSLDFLCTRGEEVVPATLLAAWFHDAIYTGLGDQDEIDSARLAAVSLAQIGLPPSLVYEVGDMIIATSPGSSTTGAALPVAHLLDADLAIFAATPQRYSEYSAAVRTEYAHVEISDFRWGRAQILRTYLERPAVYHSNTAQALWEERARANLAREIQELTNP